MSIDFDGVTVDGSPVIFRQQLGQYQLLVCQSGMVYSMTISWKPVLLFSMDTLGQEHALVTGPQLVTTTQQEH